MAKKQELEKGNLDAVKWGGIGLLWIVFFGCYYYFTTIPLAFRLGAGVVVAVISVLTLMTTFKGRSIKSFVKSSYIELQKVVWPTRKEAGQIALIVVLVVLLTGLILWGLDSLVMWVIGKVMLLNV
jgi:preprotein translocase subunit SecE